jgi:hypothetical protein
MPLPAPPPLVKRIYVSKAKQPTLPPELRPITFPDLEEVLYDKDISKRTGWRCRTCFKFHRCTLGSQQMLQCFAYFLFNPMVSTLPDLSRKVHALEQVPLTREALAPLSLQDLLGVYCVRGVSFATVVDVTLTGLQDRLLKVQRDSEQPSPYLLTTE